jgi:hypothetical protein
MTASKRAQRNMPTPGVLFDPRQMTMTPSGQWKRGDIPWLSRGAGVTYDPAPPRSKASYHRLEVARAGREAWRMGSDELKCAGAVVLSRRQERARLRAGV